MKPKKLGVIGVGLIWKKVHRSIVESMDDTFELAAFCDPSEEARAQTLSRYPDRPFLSDYRQLLALPDIEIVLILTPIPVTAKVAAAAFEAGKEVIMEKPMARSVAEGRALIETARRAGKRLFVTEQMGYSRRSAQLRQLLASGAIGDLVMWNRVMHHREEPGDDPLSYATTPWRQQADYPLGTLFDGGIHAIADLSNLFGAPAAVDAHGRRLRPEYGDYDHVAMLLHYPDGRAGSFSYAGYMPRSGRHFEIYGTAGTIAVDRHRLTLIGDDRSEQIVELERESHYENMWQAFATAFAEGSEPAYTPTRALDDVATLEAAARSIATGQRTPVESA